MPAARLRILIPLGLGLLALAVVAAGYANGGRRGSAKQLIGFGDYYEPVGDFESSQLVRLDPVTLRRLPGRPLKLRDYAESRALGPDGRTVAIGGYNYGELILVDHARLTKTAWLKVAPKVPGGNALVKVVSWPRPDRILAVVSPDGPGPQPASSSLVVIDPVGRRVVRTVPLDGDVGASLQAHSGRAVLLVHRLNAVASARLVLADTDGKTRTVPLTRILAGCAGGGHCGYIRMPALASDGRRVFVVGGREPIASVDLRTLAVKYHEVPGLMVDHLPLSRPSLPGSGGQQLIFSRDATWLGNGRLLIAGYDEFPAPVGHVRTVTRAATIVDTRSWRIQRVFQNISTLRPLGRLLLGSGPLQHQTRAVGLSLVAFRPDGTSLWRKSQSDLWWDFVAGRLIVGKSDGTHLAEVNPRTGRPIRQIAGASIWPLDDALSFSWTPPNA